MAALQLYYQNLEMQQYKLMNQKLLSITKMESQFVHLVKVIQNLERCSIVKLEQLIKLIRKIQKVIQFLMRMETKYLLRRREPLKFLHQIQWTMQENLCQVLKMKTDLVQVQHKNLHMQNILIKWLRCLILPVKSLYLWTCIRQIHKQQRHMQKKLQHLMLS